MSQGEKVSWVKLQKKNVAENVLRSWLRATDIDFREDLGGLVVAPGLRVEVVVGLREELADNTLSIPPDINSPNLAEALETFHVITAASGHGHPVPVERGIAPSQADVYGQDLFLVAARHREFRNSPDLQPAKLAEYKPVVARWARAFFRQNRELCLAHGYEVDDLLTFSWIWAHIYAHKSERQTAGDDNRRLLTRYLQQRGSELHRYLKKKARDTFPDKQTAHFSLTGEVLVRDTAEEEPVPARNIIVRERKDAAAQLRQSLASMPHDRMVLALTDASTSLNRDYATQQMAVRLLREHGRDCTACRSLPIAERGQEYVGGAHTGRDTETLEDAFG